MQAINGNYEDDPETCHEELDQILLDYIDDKEVDALFFKVPKWCA